MSDAGRNDDAPKDLLDRATDALRDEPVSEVSARLIERTQTQLRATRNSSVRSAFHHPMVRIAAVFALVTCGTAAFLKIRQGTRNAVTGTTPDAPANVAGLVRFIGVAPQPQSLSMAANATCARHHNGQVIDESVLVNGNGTLQNVVVWVSGGLEGQQFAPPKDPAVLDQQGCVYTPHVVTLMKGQRLLVKNSDPFLHNVRAAAVNNPPINFGQPTVDGGRALVFLEPDRLLVKCDVHPWMSAFVHVLDNPFFAVSGTDGSFKLPQLPPGRYEVTAWHEVFGEQKQSVTVEKGKPLSVDFTFRPTEHASAM